jgi:hypothetical protein
MSIFDLRRVSSTLGLFRGVRLGLGFAALDLDAIFNAAQAMYMYVYVYVLVNKATHSQITVRKATATAKAAESSRMETARP